VLPPLPAAATSPLLLAGAVAIEPAVPLAAEPPAPAFAAVSVAGFAVVVVVVLAGLVALVPAVALDPVEPAVLVLGWLGVSVDAVL
jgi:hypothetical protein